jgi:hypothetical protein
MTTKQKIIEIIQSYSYTTEDSLGVEIKVVNEYDFENISEEILNDDENISSCKNCKNFDIIDFGLFRCNLTKKMINEDDSCDFYSR